MITKYEKNKLVKLRKQGYSWREIAREFKKDSKCRNLSYEGLRGMYQKIAQEDKEAEAVRLINILSQKKVIQIYDLADEMDLSPKRVKETLNKLIESGKNITIDNNIVIFNEPRKGTEIDFETGNSDYIKFGIVSDTHFGSKYQQLTALYDFYNRCKSEDVQVVFHAGDWVAGRGIYKGQEYDNFLHSMKEQREYLMEKYPRTGIKTIGITGNHDESWTSLTGDSLINLAAQTRDDIEIVAEYQAFVNFNGFKVCLYHPDGGQAYAISYKLQKLVESFTAENLPDIVIMGHFHQKEYVTIRNVECFQAACFESQTPYEVRRNLHPVIGGWIVEIFREDNKIQVQTKFVKYNPKEKDW